MTKTKYVVSECPDGCDEIYIGEASTLRDARRLAAQYDRGAIAGTPRAYWDTASAANNDVPGCSAPPEVKVGEAIEWRGRSGYIAICPVLQ